MPPKKIEAPEVKPLIGRVGTNLKVGIVGVPNVGKSTFFNVLTKSAAPAENFPFCTIDPNENRVPVPDSRFDYLCEYHKPASKVPAFLNVVDIAGLVKGAAEGQGLGNAFLSHISACDAIFHLCRAFDDTEVIHVEGEVDPVRDLEIISEELRLKDEDTLLKNLDKAEKLVVRGTDKKMKPEYDSLLKVKQCLVDEKRHIRFNDWSTHDIEVLNKYLFLTSKPMIYLVNLSDKDFIRKKNKWLIKIKEWVDKNDPGATIIPFSGAYELKLAEIEDDAERKAYIDEQKCPSALDKIILAGYKALQLEYFFTAGADEVKAWTIQKGTKGKTEMEDTRERVMRIAMFPWLAMGHLLPFLRLSKLLAQEGHKIYFISTPRNINRLPKLPSNLSSSITFISFPLPSISGLPLTSESSMDVPYNMQQSLKAAFDLLQQPLTEFLQQLSPDWIIYDYASHWLPPIAAELGIYKAFFSLFNAATLCFMGPASSLIEDFRTTPEDFTVVPPWVPFESKIMFRYHEVTRYVEKTDKDVTGVSDSVRFGYTIRESDAVFVRSCPEFEPEWFSLVRNLYHKPVFATGFLPPVIEDDEDTTWVCIKEWLDKQRVNSVVYVSLGTEASLRREEVAVLALGLEKSDVPFFWVLKNEPTRPETHIPDGFEERVEGRGMVHIGWVPQVKILSHESVGGFLTHCGWNSVVKGLGFGRVPILFPVLNEQGLNTRLLQEKGLGVEVPRDEREGSFDSDSVANSVRLAMMDEEGKSVRAKAKQMKGLFGNMDKNIHHVDQLVGFMKSLK